MNKEGSLYTKEEVVEKLKEEEGFSDEDIESMINALVVEYKIMRRNGICEMEESKLKIPDWDYFVFSLDAYNSTCGPYTEEDVERQKIRDRGRRL